MIIFSRRGCHLCEDLVEQLEPLCRSAGVVLQVLDVDTRVDWREQYGLRVPVVCDSLDEISAGVPDLPKILRWLQKMA